MRRTIVPYIRCIAVLIAILTVLSLAACGKAESPAPAQTTAAGGNAVTEPVSTEPATTKITPDLPATDWKGRAFRVLGLESTKYPQFQNFEILTEELNGEIFNDTLYERNATLTERYNVKFEQILAGSSTLESYVAAGDDAIELAFINLSKIGTFTQAGYFYDMNKVKYIDFTKPWWNPDVNEATSVGGRVYCTTSDYSLRDKSRTYILLYNPDLAKANNIPDLIETIRAGKWTIDLMAQYNETVAKDLDGDGQMTDKDTWGIVHDSYNSYICFWFACDNYIVSKNSKGEFEITVNNQHTIDSIDKCVKALSDRKLAMYCNDVTGVTYDKWDFAYYAFCGGKALFETTFPHGLQSRSEEANFEYTVVPFPKFDENQEKYLTIPDPNAMVFGIPVSVKDTDFPGFMLEALSAESTDTTLHTYYEVVCKTKYSANSVSAEMLDVIFDGIRFDVDKIYGIGLYNVIEEGASEKKNTFASYYAGVKALAESNLADLKAAIAKIDH